MGLHQQLQFSYVFLSNSSSVFILELYHLFSVTWDPLGDEVKIRKKEQDFPDSISSSSVSSAILNIKQVVLPTNQNFDYQ